MNSRCFLIIFFMATSMPIMSDSRVSSDILILNEEQIAQNLIVVSVACDCDKIEQDGHKNPEDDQDDNDVTDDDSEEDFLPLESQNAMTEDDIEELYSQDRNT